MTDLNPSNIFLAKVPGPGRTVVEVAKVMNFRPAKQSTPDSAERARDLPNSFTFGPLTYLAPEALELSGAEVDARSDQWSLAVVAYQMLSGQLPFWDSDPWWLRELIRGSAEPTPLAELVPELPACVLGAIHKALSKDKQQRFATIADFIHAIEGLPVDDSSRTKPRLRIDLITQCRPDGELDAADQTALTEQTPTRPYPALSYPTELLAAVSAEPEWERDSEPRKAQGKASYRQPGTGRRLGLIGCILLALAPAPVVASLHYLYLAPRASAPAAPCAPQSAPRSPEIVAESPAPAAAPQAQLASSRLLPDMPAHKVARSRSVRPLAAAKKGPSRLLAHAGRNKTRQEQLQANLIAGLGL